MKHFDKELFNFHIELESDRDADQTWMQFIQNCLNPYFLFWGGGSDSKQFKGTISTTKKKADVKQILNAFIEFFGVKSTYHFTIFLENVGDFDVKDFLNLTDDYFDDFIKTDMPILISIFAMSKTSLNFYCQMIIYVL